MGFPVCGSFAVRKTFTSVASSKSRKFFGKGDSILYISCFDANGGLFEPLLTEQDAILSDELNHASIIDGVRLCKAQRFRYKHNDMADLKAKLRRSEGLPLQDDLHRQRVQYGRRLGETAATSARSRISTRRRSASTIATPPGTSARPGGGAEELGVLNRIDRDYRNARKDSRRRQRRLRHRARKLWTGCGTGRGHASSRIAFRLPSSLRA